MFSFYKNTNFSKKITTLKALTGKVINTDHPVTLYWSAGKPLGPRTHINHPNTAAFNDGSGPSCRTDCPTTRQKQLWNGLMNVTSNRPGLQDPHWIKHLCYRSKEASPHCQQNQKVSQQNISIVTWWSTLFTSAISPLNVVGLLVKFPFMQLQENIHFSLEIY